VITMAAALRTFRSATCMSVTVRSPANTRSDCRGALGVHATSCC
jgi:hypothetical protein